MKRVLFLIALGCCIIHPTASKVCKQLFTSPPNRKRPKLQGRDAELLTNLFALRQNCALCDKYFATSNGAPKLLVDIKRVKDIKQICQLYENKARFASVFDLKFNIPVYSAYQIKNEKDSPSVFVPTSSDPDKDKESVTWKYEPQLEDDSFPTSMMMISKLTNEAKKLKKKFNLKDIRNQPVDSDYAKCAWDIGHLFPKGFIKKSKETIPERESTLTFTNAAPQYPGFNQGYWQTMEDIVKKSMSTHCGASKAYFVTGVVPGSQDKDHRYLEGEGAKNKVAIPYMFYTAVCCKQNQMANSYSFGFYGMNHAKPNVKVVRLEDLRSKVNEKLYKMRIVSFFNADSGCDEKMDISAGKTTIKEIFNEITDRQKKLFEYDSTNTMINLIKRTPKRRHGD